MPHPSHLLFDPFNSTPQIRNKQFQGTDFLCLLHTLSVGLKCCYGEPLSIMLIVRTSFRASKRYTDLFKSHKDLLSVIYTFRKLWSL